MFWKKHWPQCFWRCLKKTKHRINDASNDVNRPPLPSHSDRRNGCRKTRCLSGHQQDARESNGKRPTVNLHAISMSKNAGMVVIRWRYVGYQVNKEVEKPATAEAPSFIRFFFFFPSFFFTVFVCCISSFKTCNCTDYQLLPKNAFPIVFFFQSHLRKL